MKRMRLPFFLFFLLCCFFLIREPWSILSVPLKTLPFVCIDYNDLLNTEHECCLNIEWTFCVFMSPSKPDSA